MFAAAAAWRLSSDRSDVPNQTVNDFQGKLLSVIGVKFFFMTACLSTVTRHFEKIISAYFGLGS